MDLSVRQLVQSAQGVGMGDLWNVGAWLSVLWIVYRVFLVYRKPTEELEEILGIDIPPVPEVTLSSIASDAVVLYWKAPDNYYSPLSLAVQVNGINGTFTRSDATIKVTRLQPDHCYGIRIVTTNAVGNPSYSNVVQVQTPPVGGHESAKLLSSFDHAVSRRMGGRRVSQPLTGKSLAPSGRGESEEEDDSQKALQKRLDGLRRAFEESEAQLKEDRREEEAEIAAITAQRDTLKAQVEERERESQELRKRVNELEKQCKASQRKKSERERKAQQKRAERQKMKDDLVRWEAEGVKIREDLQNIEQTKGDMHATHQLKLKETADGIDNAQTEATKLEEELREMGIKVKQLEDEREKVNREQNEEEKQAELRDRDEAEAHESKVHEYQHHYHALWRLNTDANQRLQDISEKLAHYMELRRRDPASFYPIAGIDYPLGGYQANNRRHRHRGPGLSMNRPGHPTYVNSSNPSPTFGASLPFAPMRTSFSGSNHAQMSPSDVDHLTAGAPMSPSADILLPSDLLGDEDETNLAAQHVVPSRQRGGSIPHIYRPPSYDGNLQDPQSPHSIDSKSPSLVSSPHDSLSNIQHVYAREPFVEDDEHALGSANAPFGAAPTGNTGGSRKIGNLLWGFNRQRDKAPLDELPAIGSLKTKESQSFPSNMGDDDQPSGRKGTGIWSPMTGPFNFLNRGGKHPESEIVPGGPMRKTRRSLLGSKFAPSDPLVSSPSRPSSTYSYDQIIGQSVLEGQIGWTTPDSTRPRGSTLAGPWSHSQSRRASLQHGSTSNLSLGSTPLDPADEYTATYNFGAAPAPIGTERFRVGQRSNTPRLNPNAPSFTTRLFNSRKPKAEKSTEFDKSKTKEGDKMRDLDAYSKSSSPPVSRLSHDAPSITTSASIGESHDSLEPVTSSHSELAFSTSGPKESLMQRITRKSSSGKFSVPWSKDRSGKGGSRKEPSTPGDLEEDPDGDYLARGSGTEAASTPPPLPTERPAGRGSLNWGRMIGKGRKRSELNMSDAGERSSEAGETEEDG